MTNTQTPPTVVNTTGAPVTNAVANHAEKPEKFNGQNFKRWQQKMFFYLTTLGLARFLKETAPQVEPPAEGQSSNAQAVQAVEAWKHSDFLCHNYVLNGLIDPLYNVYCKTTTAKELWESLERKYKTEDAGTKKFVVARFLDYKMVDSKSVVSQVQDLQVLLHDIHAEGMTLSETFQVAAIIEKLPPSWVEFKNYLKHKRKEMSVEDLVVRLRIEEDNKLAQKDTYTPESAKANMVEHAGSSSRFNSKGNKKDKRKNDKKGKGKSEYLAPKAGIVKQKFQGTCYNCDQPGHRAANCKMPKRANPRQANMVNDDVDMIAMVSDVVAMISEVNLVGTNNSGWWIDTGATRHVCADKSMFHSFRAVDNGQKLYMGNSATADIKGEGDVILKMTSEKELKLTNVLYVPEIRKNLVSGWLLNKFGFRLVFESDKFVLSKNQMYVGKGYAVDAMFKLNVMVVKNDINKMNSSAYLIESSNVWHGRLGHVNFNSMRRLIKFNSIPNFHIDSKYKCETCVEAKLTRTSFKSVKRTTEPLDMIHTDICDLKSLPTKGGNKYFITFIDDCTKYCYVYLLKSKDEAIDKFVLYKTEVENQLGKKIKVVQSDRGGEYVAPFAELCVKHGIRHEFTAPYSPQQNGIAERKNRTLKEMVTAMLISSGMSQDMWGEAILTATYLLNKIPRKEKEETPYELWMGRKPSYQYLRVWGCLAKVAVPTPKAQKIGPKSVDCIFIGYAKKSTAYRFIVHESKNPDIQKNTIMESRNASFFENIFPCLSKGTGSSSRLDDKVVQDKRQRDDNDLQDERQDQTEEEEVEPRRSKRARNEKSFGPDFVSFMVENEPTSYREAVTSSEGQQWREAIKSEIESILQNHTWELVDLPPGCKPLGYKWIFKKKMKADGTVDKYKARLVIQGFRQREGLDYFDTYSPVTRITSIRMIIAIAALRNLEIHQMDVKTAFLNGDLEEEIYMNQPEGFIAPGQEGKVCRLVKSLYGLKQAPKQWHQKFDHTMLESGFKINECDKCVYVKDTSAGYVILCLYVDDMLIVGSNDKIIRSTKDMLKSKFDMKDMGLADVILGIKIIRT
ncbi:retrovirus-related pol polyprotein from transposon TNT 1-94 [Tanacetum coccineum]|uniref:Retrovirus-related pol polyprotein from transposon TNT 1-94 n=1 Tax=Tanacetum coccineum TaxID=301880 RepID=A0ABQ5EGB3_9ASTR